jgi:hypothetical protein
MGGLAEDGMQVADLVDGECDQAVALAAGGARHSARPRARRHVSVQWRHLRLLRRHGPAAAYDAVLTGFLICGHLWDYQPAGWDTAWHRWSGRAQILIPAGHVATRFSASRIFAAAYPEAVDLACVIGSPRWRSLATGDAGQRRRFIHEIGRRLGQPGYQPRGDGDAIAHWIEYDSWHPPSRPHTSYRQTRGYGAPRPAATSQQSLQRQEFSTRRSTGSVSVSVSFTPVRHRSPAAAPVVSGQVADGGEP